MAPSRNTSTMVAVRMSVTSGMLRSSAIWQSGSTLITPQDKASRRFLETRSSRKSGTRLTASIKESRPPASRQRDHLGRPDRAKSLAARSSLARSWYARAPAMDSRVDTAAIRILGLSGARSLGLRPRLRLSALRAFAASMAGKGRDTCRFPVRIGGEIRPRICSIPDQIGVRHQSQNCQGARPRPATHTARPRRRSD